VVREFDKLDEKENSKYDGRSMDIQKFRELLDESYQWPDYYEFKFIIRTDDKLLIIDKLAGFTIHETPSKKGNYTSVSARKLMSSTDEVLKIYELMSTVKGVISL
jgi:putative lipoic acid-binding regulatory protein